MSYKILVDGVTLYDPTQKDYTLLSAKLEQELNTAGTLSISIPQSNPSYGLAKLMKSVIEVYDDDTLLFSGRPYAPSFNLYKDNELIIEGELAYLNDSVYAPYSYNGDVSSLFTALINNHNEQVDTRRQFKIGTCNVTNSTADGNITRSDSDYSITWDLIQEKLLDKLGGYLFIRHEDDGTYIDYLNDSPYSLNAPVTTAINLIDANEELSSDGLATVIMPLGVSSEEEDEDGNTQESWLTIEEVNDGSPYIESADGIELYGRIVRVVHHDDITLASNLLRAGQNDLANALGLTKTYTIKAADLNKAGYTQFDTFKVGKYINVKVPTLDIDTSMLIRSISIDLMNPGSNTLTVGKEFTTLTESSRKTTNTINESISDVKTYANEKTISKAFETIREVNALITNNAEQLQSQFSEKYYDKNNVDNLLSEISTMITQTADAITFEFNQYKSSQETTNNETQATFEQWRKYIRFVDGNIELGEESNPITLTIENDRLSFSENGVEVAYLNNQSLHITDSYVINSLNLGQFAFFPRTSGNLSFKKVGG